MLNIPSELVELFDCIELNYNVSCILFAKYKKIFKRFFLMLSSLKNHQVSNLFKFGWILFVYIKESYLEDWNIYIWSPFYLLICCINLLYESLKENNEIIKSIIIKLIIICVRSTRRINYKSKR